MKKQIILIITIIVLPVLVFAQSDGSAISDPKVTPTPIDTTVAPVSATSAARTVVPSPIPTPRPTPPPVTPTPTVSIELMTDYNTAPVQDSAGIDWSLIGIIGASVAGILGFLGFKMAKKGGQNKKQDGNRCDSIKELLEQKKKELEESIRKWPEEKLKSMAKEKAIGALKKNEDAKKVIETAESLKAKHDKLKGTIEMLQKKYDLCTLELPSTGNNFKGTIVENSLVDRSILEKLKVVKKYNVEDWTLHDVLINEEKIEKLRKYLSDGPWYMHFWQEGKDDVIVAFKDKSFKIKYSDKSTWKEAIEHGKSKGIPEEQLDFAIN